MRFCRTRWTRCAGAAAEDARPLPAKGKPRFVATPEQRRQVEMYAAVGMTQEQIALLLECSVDTLDRHFRRELDTGSLKANAKVAGTLFNKAMAGDVGSMVFWLKTRARWKETYVQEHLGVVVNITGKDAEL